MPKLPRASAPRKERQNEVSLVLVEFRDASNKVLKKSVTNSEQEDFRLKTQ